MKQPKQKNCIECGKLFNQYNSLVKVCSTECAIKVAKVKVKKEVSKQWQKEKKEIKEKLKTKSSYEADLQKEINQIIKYIDMYVNCISSNRPLAESRNSGHIFSVGSNPTLRFNLHNIYNQSISDNKDKGGQPLEAMEGIKNMYGQEQYDYVLGLKKQYKYIGLSIDELKEKITIARSIVKHLKLENKTYNSIQRIDLRRQFNKMIGIYN